MHHLFATMCEFKHKEKHLNLCFPTKSLAVKIPEIFIIYWAEEIVDETFAYFCTRVIYPMLWILSVVLFCIVVRHGHSLVPEQEENQEIVAEIN